MVTANVMKLVPDPTRRFARRPHYEPWELDLASEDVVVKLLTARHGDVTFPISTDDLTVLIEQEADDLDSAADLSDVGDDVEGVTDFFRNKKPKVRIAAYLWEGPSRENRLRTTLSHEFGHVHFHNYLYQVEAGAELFTSLSHGAPLQCKRETIHGPLNRDWMEWQAGYVCGSLLMPISHLRRMITVSSKDRVSTTPLLVASTDGQHMVNTIATEFQVSRDAARVRLLQLNYVTEIEPQPSFNLG